MTQDASTPVDPERGPNRPLQPGSPTSPIRTDTSGARGSTGPGGKDPLRSSLTAQAWIGIIALTIVLILLIIFIAQNTHKVTVKFLGWDGSTPLAVALLIATVAGLFLATVAGTLRIWQLRRRVRREGKRAR
jgi:uncharacterized integral membrane protein